jgi:3-oxoacyl-[acyl-carrier-protein] synthase II
MDLQVSANQVKIREDSSISILQSHTSHRVAIVDAVAISALGSTPDQLWQGLLSGQCAIKKIRRFPTHLYHGDIAACIDGLNARDETSMIHYLIERLFEAIGPVPLNTVLLTATTKGGIDNLEKYCRLKPADCCDFLPAFLPQRVADRFGLRDTGLNINAACASATVALARGAQIIAAHGVETVLVCCLDLVTEFVYSGFSALSALAPAACRPFDRDRDGLSLGDGAAALLLMPANRARDEKQTILGTIEGWGVACDATHFTAPARDACGLVQAIAMALDRAGLKPEDIGAVSAHGTGTVYNDRMELNAFEQIFHDQIAPVYSVKGSIGHTLGAAGGIEAVIGLQVLANQIVPPTAGFKHPAIGAEKCVFTTPVTIGKNHLLSTNSGFGGINAALILGTA